MPKGSVCRFTGSTLHAGGANRTGGRRVGMLIGYVLGWLAQEQNMYVTVPPDKAKTLDAGVQDLIGYPATERGPSAYNASNQSAYTGKRTNASAGGRTSVQPPSGNLTCKVPGTSSPRNMVSAP